MCPAREKDRIYAVLTNENDAVNVATGPKESSHSDDNDKYPGTLTAEECDQVHQRNVRRPERVECRDRITVQHAEGMDASSLHLWHPLISQRRSHRLPQRKTTLLL